MQYSNNQNIPLPLAVFLATDDYDYQPNTISATTLLKPIKQIVLSKRIEQDTLVDISSLINSRMGTAIHTAFEKAWLNPSYALKKLSYSDDFIKRIKVNPSEVNDKDIPVYMEQRSFKELDGFTVSGKFDFVAEGKVQDVKSTSVYTYLNQINKDKYIQQGSIYRWLNQDIITKDTMNIIYLFTAWNKLESLKNKDYPQYRYHIQQLPLMSLDETEQFVKSKLAQIKRYDKAKQSEIPACTDEDLWRKPTVYKYFKNPDSVRSTKNFETKADAYRMLSEQGTGVVKEVKGTVSACKYCPAVAICEQAQSLILNGDLVL